MLSYTTEAYSLSFPEDRPFVYLEAAGDQRLAELFVLSSVHPFHGRDHTLTMGVWEMSEKPGETIFSLKVESTAWQSKTYRLRCYPHRFTYEIEVEGWGQLCEANYFGGYYSGQVRWGSGFFWSGQQFMRGFNPEPNTAEQNYFTPAENSTIDLVGVPLPGKATWFFTPPPFCFAMQRSGGWLSIGVETQPGQNRFTEYAYHGQQGAFYLSLSYEGHTAVHGRYTLPAIGFIFAEDEYTALARHVDTFARPPGLVSWTRGDWWCTPIFCGWGAQCYVASQEKGRAPDYSRQDLYEGFITALERNSIQPGMIVLDDKWQAAYGENRADPFKWPDLPGFVRDQHANGRKVLLWLKAWDAEGLPPDECITNAAGFPLTFDPSNPAFERRLRASVERMLSADGYNADGFKIDFTARIPSGPGICTYGDVWGLELMRTYLYVLHSEAKRVKPDALIMSHTPHPYLRDVVDMIRLNDINTGKPVLPAMNHRARVAGIACPDALIDTDNWPIPDKNAWREYLLLQPKLGIPTLYYATHIDSSGEPLEAADYALIRETWARYRSSPMPQEGRLEPSAAD